jgi:hypothetical protein
VSLRRSTLLRLVFYGGLLVAGTISFLLLRNGKPKPLGEPPPIEGPAQSIGPSARQQFLECKFVLVTEVKRLPTPVRRALTEQGGSRFVMADPGKKFQVTDVVTDPSLPWLRLVFAGISGDNYFIHYEQGGYGHSYHLALLNAPSQEHLQYLWKGYCKRAATSLEDLRSLVADGSCSQE